MIDYRCTETGQRFHESDAVIKMVMGPFGSGKSTMAVMDLLYNSLAQPAAPDGVRYSRWGIIRRTYGELKNTTRKLLIETLPAGAGYITKGNPPMSGVFRFALKDGTTAQMELEMWAMDDERSLQNIRSANWTGCWINEGTEVSLEVLEVVMGRRGRYPSKDLGGCRWGGVLMDFNPFPEGHWLESKFNKPSLSLRVDDELMEFPLASFVQPPAAFKRENEDGTVTYVPNKDEIGRAHV